jgi:hypothetical protein
MEMKDEYEKHQSRKIKAREEKKKDKEMGISSPDLFFGTFDLQAVLQTPCSLVSQLYYMRKLNCYTYPFTIWLVLMLPVIFGQKWTLRGDLVRLEHAFAFS